MLFNCIHTLTYWRTSHYVFGMYECTFIIFNLSLCTIVCSLHNDNLNVNNTFELHMYNITASTMNAHALRNISVNELNVKYICVFECTVILWDALVASHNISIACITQCTFDCCQHNDQTWLSAIETWTLIATSVREWASTCPGSLLVSTCSRPCPCPCWCSCWILSNYLCHRSCPWSPFRSVHWRWRTCLGDMHIEGLAPTIHDEWWPTAPRGRLRTTTKTNLDDHDDPTSTCHLWAGRWPWVPPVGIVDRVSTTLTCLRTDHEIQRGPNSECACPCPAVSITPNTLS